jgi:hypothetical protein
MLKICTSSMTPKRNGIASSSNRGVHANASVTIAHSYHTKMIVSRLTAAWSQKVGVEAVGSLPTTYATR